MDSSEKNIFYFIFNEDSKNNVFNLMQVSFIALIPLYFLSKILNFLPKISKAKGILELIFEIFLHVFILIIGIVIIVKFTLFFKPLSGVPYPDNFSIYPIITVCIFGYMSTHSSLNDKMNMVKEKITNKISPENTKETKSQTPQNHPQVQSLQPTQTQPQQTQQTQETQQLPNYNQMYQNQPIDTFEPQAANEAFGSMGTNF